MKAKQAIFMLVTIISTMISGCTFTNENKLADAVKVVKEKFEIEEVLIASVGYSESELKKEDTKRFCYYILGKNNNNQQIFVVVPALKSQEPYQIDWPFNKSFNEIVTDLNSSVKGQILNPMDYKKIELIDSQQNMLHYDDSLNINDLDFKLMIYFNGYTIVQINKVIIIKGDGF